ncbi:MAG: hypothetical protein IJ248_00950 [Candidatus Methanomethylophilaceae archaeon]|nr:hypothetical protein [Candidatus Methanomethylophilaceae archaeon]
MNTRTLALVAIIAVAAVAIVGAGYALYWGQTTVDDNVVDSNYISVALTESSGADYTAIDLDVDYNTVYTYGTSAEYKISPNGYLTKTAKNYGFETIVENYNLVPLKNKASGDYTVLDNYEFTLKAPETMAADSYDFNVTLTGVTLGSAATLYFAYTETADALAAGTTLYPFYPTGTEKEYVATPVGPAITTGSAATGYTNTYYGYLFVGIAGKGGSETVGDATTHYVTVADVNSAKAKITAGDLTFKATVERVTVTEDDEQVEKTKIQQTSSITKNAASTITIGTKTAELDGCIVSVASYDITTTAPTVTDSTASAGTIVSFTAVNESGTYYILLKFTSGNDVFYRAVTAAFE